MKYCKICGTEAPDSAIHCDYCDNMFEFEEQTGENKGQRHKPENIPAGILGALVGAVIGAAAIILVSRLGYVASLCGLVLAFCTLKGYELLSGSMSKVGVVICLVIMLATPYLADRLDWAILLMQDYQKQYAEALPMTVAFQMVPDMIREEVILESEYMASLVKLYVFTVIGGGVSVVNAFRKK